MLLEIKHANARFHCNWSLHKIVEQHYLGQQHQTEILSDYQISFGHCKSRHQITPSCIFKLQYTSKQYLRRWKTQWQIKHIQFQESTSTIHSIQLQRRRKAHIRTNCECAKLWKIDSFTFHSLFSLQLEKLTKARCWVIDTCQNYLKKCQKASKTWYCNAELVFAAWHKSFHIFLL